MMASKMQSPLTSIISDKKHRLYCRFKSFLRAIFQYKSNTTLVKLCKHKCHHDKCKECTIRMESADVQLRPVYFYCEDPECPGREYCIRDPVDEAYGSEADMRVAPLRLNVKSRTYFSHHDDQSSDSAFHNTYNTGTNSSRSIASTNLFPNPLFSSDPTHLGTPDLYSSPTEYSFNHPSYFTAQHTDSLISRHAPISPSQEAFTSSRQTLSSAEVLEENASATSVRITPASPTTVHIRHPKTSTVQRGETRATSPLLPELPGCDLDIIVRSAIYSDIETQAIILELHRRLSPSPDWSDSERHLIRKARLVLGLCVQKAAGHISASMVQSVSAQLFPENNGVQSSMHIDDFTDYICEAVDRGDISEARAMQIVTLVDDEDMQSNRRICSG